MFLNIIAPWIVDTWRDALFALSFDIPTLSIAPNNQFMVLGCTAFVLAALTWHSVGLIPAKARGRARSFMALLLILPAAFATGYQFDAIGQLQIAFGQQRLPASAPDPTIQTQRLPQFDPLPQTPPSSQIDVAAEPSLPTLQPTPPPQVTIAAVEPRNDTAPELPSASQPPTPATGQPSPTATANAAVRRLTQNLTRLLQKSTHSDTTSVFFGTDRMAVPGQSVSGRPDGKPGGETGGKTSVDIGGYTDARAGRLEFGRARIKVPRPDSTKQAALSIGDVTPLLRDDFLEASVMQLARAQRFKDHVLIFVPGFNSSFDGTLYRAAQLASDLAFDGAVFVYSWPSVGRAADYAYDSDSISRSGIYFADFLRVVLQQTGAKTVSFISHGLGARLTLDVLATFKDQVPADVRVRDLLLTAPDIDTPTFAARLNTLSSLSARTTLYVASSDRALNISRRYSGGIPRAGDVLAGGPMVMPAVETVDVSASGTHAVSLNHPGYVKQAALLRDIAQRLDTVGSAASQTSAGESIATPKGPYLLLR